MSSGIGDIHEDDTRCPQPDAPRSNCIAQSVRGRGGEIIVPQADATDTRWLHMYNDLQEDVRRTAEQEQLNSPGAKYKERPVSCTRMP